VHKPMPDGSKRQIGGPIADPDRYLATRADTWWDNFHVFSVEWTPKRYVFRIDGHEVWRTREGVSDVHEFLILSMLSNDFELPLVGSDPKPRTAERYPSYIRVLTRSPPRARPRTRAPMPTC